MSFDASRSSYDRYMGRYSNQLAHVFADFAVVPADAKVLDVGCGPGALTEVLATRTSGVAAADPSESFVVACGERVPDADVRLAPAAQLPWNDDSFDLVVSQLVLNFLPDADAGLREMSRVARPGATIAACTWDYRGRMQMLRTFWDAALTLDPDAPGEQSTMPFCSQDELVATWQAHGLRDITSADLEVSTTYDDFEEYWLPFTLGVGPGGAYATSLDAETLEQLKNACFTQLGSPTASFDLTAVAVAVRGRQP
ncbi:class I SAM-dependent methyltransferase [Aeromicrobium panaciterrae]|uniref:class I SAM-dependent methyltransferase n=1 Tax=Aeromicrobium panaciterrae TaxID=363861 RepID=UPI0031DF4C3E